MEPVYGSGSGLGANLYTRFSGIYLTITIQQETLVSVEIDFLQPERRANRDSSPTNRIEPPALRQLALLIPTNPV